MRRARTSCCLPSVLQAASRGSQDFLARACGALRALPRRVSQLRVGYSSKLINYEVYFFFRAAGFRFLAAGFFFGFFFAGAASLSLPSLSPRRRRAFTFASPAYVPKS